MMAKNGASFTGMSMVNAQSRQRKSWKILKTT
jgi:hypothetical protein